MARIQGTGKRTRPTRSSSASTSSSNEADVLIKADLDVNDYTQGLNKLEAETKRTVDIMAKEHEESANKISTSTNLISESNNKAAATLGTLSSAVRAFMKEMFIISFVIGIITKIGDAVLKTDFALKSLQATARAFNQDVGKSTKVMNELASDGLLTVKQASEGLRYLIQSGYTVEQAENMAKAMKDIGAYNNTIGDLGQAFVDAAKGIRTGRVQLTDNLGLTERFSQIMKRANIDISNGIDLQSNYNQRAAFYNSLMQQRIKFEGDAKRSSSDLSGEWLKLKNQMFTTTGDLGKAFETPFRGFMSLSTVVLGTVSILTKSIVSMFKDIDAELNKTTWWKEYKENFKTGWQAITEFAKGDTGKSEEQILKEKMDKAEEALKKKTTKKAFGVEFKINDPKWSEKERLAYEKAVKEYKDFLAKKAKEPKQQEEKVEDYMPLDNIGASEGFGGMQLSVTKRWRDAKNKLLLAKLDLENENITKEEYAILEAEYNKEKNIYEGTINIAKQIDAQKKTYEKDKLKNDMDEKITVIEQNANVELSKLKAVQREKTEQQKTDADFDTWLYNQIQQQRQEDIDFWNEEEAMALETQREQEQEAEEAEEKRIDEEWDIIDRRAEQLRAKYEQEQAAKADMANLMIDAANVSSELWKEAHDEESKNFNLAKSLGFHKYANEIREQYNIEKQKIMDDETLTEAQKFEKLMALNKKYNEDLKAAKQEEVDLHNWSAKMQQTAMDRLIRGKELSFVMIRELLKQELKEWMYSEGTKYGLKALSEGVEALICAANPLTWGLVPGHLAAAGAAAAAATTFGVAANAIQVDTSQIDKFNDGTTQTTDTTKVEDKKRLYIHTTDAEIIRKLVPEIGQAIDDGVEIVIGGDNQ